MSITKGEFQRAVAVGDCFVKSTSEGEVSLVYADENIDPLHLYSGKYQHDEFLKFVRWLEDVGHKA